MADRLTELRSRLHFSDGCAVVADVGLPDSDEPVLGGAIAARCTHLWAGDKRHFGRLYGKTIRGVKIVSGPMLADELATAIG